MEIDIISQKLANTSYISRKNLEIVLGKNRRTLDERISSLIKKRIITRVRKGFYLVNSFYEKEANKSNLLEYIGNIAYSPSYISLEYALSFYNVIPESVYKITYITTKKTRDIDFDLGSFIYKSIKSDLFTGFESKDYIGKNVYFAKRSKALFDFLYLMALRSDVESIKGYLRSESRINFSLINKRDLREFKKYVKISGSNKMKEVESAIVKAINES